MKQLCVVCSGPMGLFSEKFELCWCSEPEIKQDSLTQSNWLLDTAHSFRARKWAEQVEFGQSASNPWHWYTALPPMFEQSLWDLSRAAQLWNYFTYKISASFSARAAERRVCRLGMKVVCRACVDVVMKCNTSDQGRWRGRAEKWRKEVNHLPSAEKRRMQSRGENLRDKRPDGTGGGKKRAMKRRIIEKEGKKDTVERGRKTKSWRGWIKWKGQERQERGEKWTCRRRTVKKIKEMRLLKRRKEGEEEEG